MYVLHSYRVLMDAQTDSMEEPLSSAMSVAVASLVPFRVWV